MLQVGTLHPVSGPAIQDAVVVITGGRIRAVGKSGEVEVPADAEVIAYPRGHAYPGLVDAHSTVFAEPAAAQDGSATAGSEIQIALDRSDHAGRELASHGVTTAYVSNRGAATWRGLGTLLRPTQTGYERFRLRGGEPLGGIHLRLTSGFERGSHPLDRQRTARTVSEAFRALEAYQKSLADHAEALKKYEKEFAAYLDHHRKAKGQAAPDSGEQSKPEQGKPEQGADTEQPPQGRGRRGAGRGGVPGGRPGPAPAGETPAQPAPKAEGDKPAADSNEAQAKPAPANGAPKRPPYPKAPAKDPAKDSLQQAKAGERILRIEAQRRDEIRMALALQQEWQLPRIALEGATEAGPLAAQIAAAGVPVILDDLATAKRDPAQPQPDPGLAARLSSAGASVAIASGGGRRGRFLPLLAAIAVGHGLDPEQALRAITLTPAAILGVDREIGSIEPGKLGDLLVTSGPLLASDTQVLHVLARGTTVFRAQETAR